MKQGVVLLFYFLAILISPALLFSESLKKEIKIGVLAKRGKEHCLKQWGATAKYLSEKLPSYHFVIVPLDFHEILPAAEMEQVHFILANSSYYVSLEKDYRAQRIATLKNLRLGKGYTSFGGTVITSRDNPSILNLKDLANVKFMAVDPNSLGGWHAAWRELKSHGIDPYKDFKALLFGGTHDAVVYAVLNGEVDAGTVRSDTLERMDLEDKIEISDFRVVHRVPSDKEIPFLHSTRAYPEWPLAKLSYTSDVLAEKLVSALLIMSPDSEAARDAKITGWSIPANYEEVKACLKELKLGPYKTYGQIDLKSFISAYQGWVIAIIVLFSLIVIAIFYALFLNKRLKRSLSALAKENVQREEAEEYNKHLTEVLGTLRTIDRIIFREKDSNKLLQKVCDTLINIRGFQQAWIALYDDKKRLTTFVHSGLEFYKVDLKETMSDCDRVPCISMALESQRSVLLQDREELCHSCPLGVDIKEHVAMVTKLAYQGYIFGCLSVSLPRTKIVQQEERELFEELAEDLSFALFALRQEKERQAKTEELKIAKKQAESAARTKAAFLANMSHEIRTPLTAILGFNGLLLESVKDNEALELLKIIDDNGQHLLQVINDILNFSKVEAGRESATLAPFSLHSMLRQIIDLLDIRAKDKGISLDLEFRSALPEEVVSDSKKLKQILINLIDNAIKFTKQGGVKIEVHAAPLAERRLLLRFYIVDTGIGITSSEQARLFEPFCQSDESSSREFGGTGLGLSISAYYARLLGGEVKVVKSEKGIGTKMLLEIEAEFKGDLCLKPECS